MARFSLACFSLLLVLLGLSAFRASAAEATAEAASEMAIRAATSAEPSEAGGESGGRSRGERGEGDGVVRAEVIVFETELLKPAEIYQDTPVETEILTEEDLRRLPAVDAIEALEAIPGIRITRQVQGQRGAVRIDGLPPEFTELLVNGQRYAGENGEAQDLGDLLFANLDRIEILRGPQALRYTSRAAGGVVNIITKDPPRDGWTVSGLGAAGDQDRVSAEANLGWGTESFGGVFTYDFNRIGGFRTPDDSDGLSSPFGEGSLFRTHDLYGTIVARPNPALELKTRLGYRLRDEGFAIDDGPITARRENERWLLSQDLRFTLLDTTTLFGTLTSSYEDQDSSVGREFELIDDRTRLELGLEHVQPLGSTMHVFTLGADLSTNGIQMKDGPLAESIDNDDLEPADVDERFFRAGLYAILESDLNGWLQTELGVRYQMHEDFKPELLPQAAILIKAWRWGPDRALKLRLSAGRAVRFPALRELFQPPSAQLGGAYFLAGSEDLSPEKAWAFRAGLEANPKRWISGSVVGFYSEASDRIRAFGNGDTIRVGEEVIPANPVLCAAGLLEFCSDQVSPTESSIFASANLDDVESFGIEARLELRPHETVELKLGYIWNRTRVTDSNIDIDELPNSPRHVANGQLRLTAPVSDTVLTLRGQWRSRALIEQSGTGLLSFATGEKSDPSFEMDLRLLQPLERWLGREIDLFFDVNNVTDNRVIDSLAVRGRSFLAGIRGSFP